MIWTTLAAAMSCGDERRGAVDAGAVTANGGMQAPVAVAGSAAGVGVPPLAAAGGAGSTAPRPPVVGGSDGSSSSGTGGSRSTATSPEDESADLDAGGGDISEPDEPPAFPPLVTDGAPLQGSTGAWTYSEIPDTYCRDGSTAGVYVNLGTTNKLMIFLEGGGRCADAQTCGAFPGNIADGELIRGVASAGVLDRSRRENPVGDWNFAYVPYCTGDRHGGANPDGNVPGVGPQKFVGHLNLEKLLNRIVPTFRDSTDVLLTGISAGGFGVAYNAVLVQQAFSNVRLKVIIDSAPFVSPAVFTPCDQERTRAFYRAEQTFLGACGAACPNPNDYWMDFGVFLARTFADRPTGLISSTEDLVERALFGIGVEQCTAAFDLLNPAISAETFRADILAYRARISAFPNASTFYPDNDVHTFIAFDAFYTATAGGVRLVDWFRKIVTGESPGHAGP